MTRLRLAALIVLIALASALLAGCSDDPEPIMPDPTTAAASPTTPSPSGPVEPTLPPEAAGEDNAAAEAFVRHYYDVVNFAQSTGSVDGLRSVSDDTCGGCQAGITGIESIYEKGGTIDGGAYSVDKAEATPAQGLKGPAFDVFVRTSHPSQAVDYPDKDRDVQYDGGKSEVLFTVKKFPEGWQVLYYEVTK